MNFLLNFLIILKLLFHLNLVLLEQIELVPKMIRRPTHLDHYLCRQLHNGPGIRSLAVTNLSGLVCRTYCRVLDRIGGKIFYTENISPNFLRCGPYQARCVDGNCIGFNYPYGIIQQLISASQQQQNHGSNDGDAINNNEDATTPDQVVTTSIMDAASDGQHQQQHMEPVSQPQQQQQLFDGQTADPVDSSSTASTTPPPTYSDNMIANEPSISIMNRLYSN